MAYTNLTDVAATLGRSITDELEMKQVNAWINGAELLIQSKLGDLSALDAETLRYVTSECVARRVRNPEGKQNERIDDYSYGLSKDAAKAGLSITEEEWEMLTPASVFQPSSFGIMAGGVSDSPAPRGWWLE